MNFNSINIGYHLRWTIIIVLALIMAFFAACASPSTPASVKPDKDAPVIHFVIAEKQVKPESTSTIQCLATGKQGDILNYEWSSTGGEIQGEGNVITWVAPSAEGANTITVVVSNGNGSQAIGWANINVSGNTSPYPVVISVTCADCRNGAEQASRWQEYKIICEAEDPDGDKLAYQWLATMGKIEPLGMSDDYPYAAFSTLNQSGNALIKVIVTDEDGNQAEGYLSINISCCH